MAAMRFESGECKGQSVTAVSKVYLIWAYHNLPMSVELKAAIGVVLRRYRVNLEGESK